MMYPKRPNLKDPANYRKYGLMHSTCEKCGAEAVDVHHIIAKGMGGGKVDDRDINLIALCRPCHTWAHSGNTRGRRIELQLIKEGKL